MTQVSCKAKVEDMCREMVQIVENLELLQTLVKDSSNRIVIEPYLGEFWAVKVYSKGEPSWFRKVVSVREVVELVNEVLSDATL